MRLWQKLTAGAMLSAALLGTGIFSASLTADAAAGTVTLDTSGKLTLSGDVTKEQIWAYRDNENVTSIFADPGCTFPEDCSRLFEGYEIDPDGSYHYNTVKHWKKVTTIDLRGADTSRVRNMSGMFAGLNRLETLKVSGLDTSKVTDMSSTFSELRYLNALDLSGWDTSNVTTMFCMFDGLGYEYPSYAPSGDYLSLNISSFDTSKVTDMAGMFAGCYAKTLDLRHFDTSNVTDMTAMFASCEQLIDLDVSSFETSKVTSMARMFRELYRIPYLDLSNFNTSNVTDMSWMFMGCGKLETVDLSSFNTSKVTDMTMMFSGYFKHLDLSGFDTSNVKSMKYMFSLSKNLTELELSSFDTSKVSDMYGMFDGCAALKTITVSDRWKTDAVGDSTNMFSRCPALTGGNGTTYDAQHTDKEYARIDGEGTPGYFTRGSVPLSAENVTLSKTSFPYTGKEVKTGSYIKVRYNGKALKYGTDFTLSYADNVKCGIKTAKVTVIGKGMYSGRITKTYTITPAVAAAPKLSTKNGRLHIEWAAVANAQGYQIQYCKDASFTGSTLHSTSVDASRTYVDLKTYPKAGETWYVRVRAYIASAAGTKYGTYGSAASTVVGRIGSVSLSQTDFAYTGKAVKVGNYISVRSGDTKLKYNTDFTLTYKNNINAGTATVTVKGIGEYAGSVSFCYFINAA